MSVLTTFPSGPGTKYRLSEEEMLTLVEAVQFAQTAADQLAAIARVTGDGEKADLLSVAADQYAVLAQYADQVKRITVHF